MERWGIARAKHFRLRLKGKTHVLLLITNPLPIWTCTRRTLFKASIAPMSITVTIYTYTSIFIIQFRVIPAVRTFIRLIFTAPTFLITWPTFTVFHKVPFPTCCTIIKEVLALQTAAVAYLAFRVGVQEVPLEARRAFGSWPILILHFA